MFGGATFKASISLHANSAWKGIGEWDKGAVFEQQVTAKMPTQASSGVQAGGCGSQLRGAVEWLL